LWKRVGEKGGPAAGCSIGRLIRLMEKIEKILLIVGYFENPNYQGVPLQEEGATQPQIERTF